MKKLLFILAIALTGCTCVMSQTIPPQEIPINAGCQGIVPDFRALFTYTDNCGIDTVMQEPAPGYILTAEENSINIQIIALDVFNNFSTVTFPATVVELIPPVIRYNSEIVSINSPLKFTK